MGRGAGDETGWLSEAGDRAIIPPAALASFCRVNLTGGQIEVGEEGDGELLLRFKEALAQLRARVDSSPDPYTDDEGGRSVAYLKLKVFSGVWMTDDGLTDLAPGIYLMTGNRFERISNLAGVDDRKLASDITEEKREQDLLARLPVWDEVPEMTREALLAIYQTADHEYHSGSSLGDMAFHRTSWSGGHAEEMKVRELLKPALQDAYERGLAYSEDGEGAEFGWRLTELGKRLVWMAD